MDTFDHNDLIPEPEFPDPVLPELQEESIPEASAEEASAAAEDMPSAYHGAGTGRKESPYADSP
jgi:hypothetical protein